MCPGCYWLSLCQTKMTAFRFLRAHVGTGLTWSTRLIDVVIRLRRMHPSMGASVKAKGGDILNRNLARSSEIKSNHVHLFQ